MHRIKAGFFAVCLFSTSIFLLSGEAIGQAGAPDEKPVAVVGGEELFEKDYLSRVQSYEIRKRDYEMRRDALFEAINKKLLEIEAEKQGVSPEELLAQAVKSTVPEPSEVDVERRFVAQMFGPARQITKSRDEIRSEMIQEKAGESRDLYFRTLREQANVKIYLLPPRMEVDYDPKRVRGDPHAQITIVEFSDFQCGYCLQAYLTVKNLLRKYEGKVKLAYRDLPLEGVGINGIGSADAARCAQEQGKFWEFHDLLFENQDYTGPAAFREYAEKLDLDAERFDTCLESGKFKPLIKADFEEGISLGIRGTPFFFINGVPLNGARPQADFEEIIEVLLFLGG